MRYIRAAGVRDQRSTPSGDDHSWAHKAACSGMPLDLFFGPPYEREPAKSLREADALQVCAACPVRIDCLEDALIPDPKQQHGIAGGMTAEERISERRKRARRLGGKPQRKVAKRPARKPSRVLVDATGTMRRLQALATRGIGSKTVERHCAHGSHGHLGDIRNGDCKKIDARVAKAVADAYPRLAALPPGPNGGQAFALARAKGWAPPEAWDGADIDDPRSEPRTVRIPAVGFARRLQAAAVAGVPISVAVQATGLSRTFLSKLRSGGVDTLRPEDAEALRKAWPQVAASEAFSPGTIGQAVTHGWLPLSAWEGVDIDDPDARPRQTAAA